MYSIGLRQPGGEREREREREKIGIFLAIN